jgi:pilus assembly protein Flp/PilA
LTNPSEEETIMKLIFKFARDEDGAAALEYALILTILGIALMGGMTSIGTSLTGVFSDVAGHLTGS